MKKICHILWILIMAACSLPESKPLKLEKDVEQLTSELKQLSNFADAKVKWSIRTVEEKTESQLTIELFDGVNVPQNEIQLRDLGREASKVVANSISNEDDYDVFKVVFVQKFSAGIASASITKDFEYTVDELK